jgi:protein O-GlcNAc transferase
MIDLDLETRTKLKNLYIRKQFSQIEREIETFKSLDGLPSDIKMLYAVSKSLNPLSKRKDLIIASYFFDKVFVVNKLNLEPFYNLILTSVKSEFFDYLEPHINEQYKKNIQDPKILEGLAKMYTCYGNMVAVSFYYRELIKIKPKYVNAWTSLLSSFNYHEKINQIQYLDYCKKFDQLPNEKLKKIKKKYLKGKIKLGFFSTDFKIHSVSFFLENILSKIDKSQFELYALSNLEVNSHDVMTNDLKKIFDNWYDTVNLSDNEFIDLARGLDLDILFDLSGYFSGNRIQAFRARCAPTQVSWLGYCNSLGIKNMDYLIADKNLILKDEQDQYSEKVLYMPNIWSTISLPKNLDQITIKQNKEKRDFTYGSFNNFEKISDRTLKVWSKILNKSDKRLVLKNSSGKNSKKLNKIILERFKNEKVDIKKIVILTPTLTREEHLDCYNQIDLALDTFPYPGVTTTFESILMGVPVLTKKGFNFVSRTGVSINLNLDMNDFIAENEDDYFKKAIEAQSKTKLLNELKLTLRNKFSKSDVFNSKKFTIDFSNLLKTLL